jgi:hypothetical protein
LGREEVQVRRSGCDWWSVEGGRTYFCVTCASSSRWTAVLKRLQKFGSRGTAMAVGYVFLVFCLSALDWLEWSAVLLVDVGSSWWMVRYVV